MSVRPRWLAAVILAFGFLAAAVTGASAEVRSLKLYHLHTHEKAEIVYKRNGRYDPEGLRKINIILRDWRRNEPTKMDPRLLDLVWEAYHEAGATDYIQVVQADGTRLRPLSETVARCSTLVMRGAGCCANAQAAKTDSMQAKTFADIAVESEFISIQPAVKS